MKAQGTELYVVDPGDSDGNPVLDVGCVLDISGIDSTNDENETTCLADLARTYEAGLATPGEASFTLQFDPANPTHVRLHELKKLGVTLKWALGWSDGRGIAPTGADTDGDFILPNTRSWIEFDGFMKNFPFQFARGEQVTSAVNIRMSGDPILTPKT
jgi:hypothetical protein